MSAELTRRTRCRLCDSPDLELVVAMPPCAIADAYVPAADKDKPQAVYPLDLYFCSACAHVQLLDVVDPRLMFKPDYTYRTGSTPAVVKHFREYAERVLARERPAPGSLVIDVGSNDGTFLSFFKQAGLKTLGIDPALTLAREATAAGIETLPRFLDLKLAQEVRRERGPARLVSANNVFAHTDDMAQAAESIRALLAPEGLFVFEVSYVVDVVEQMLLGTIFHEHLCYHSVKPLAAFLNRHGLELVDVERVGIQGGSLIGYAQLQGGPRQVAPAVAELLRYESEHGFGTPEVYHAMNRKLDVIRDDLARLLDDAAKRGETIAGYGAARGGTALLYRLDLGRRLSFIVDDSPSKQGLLSPGHHIPILPSAALYERRPNYVFILAWVHAKAIMQTHRRYLDEGGRFIKAYPKVEVVSAAEASALK